MCHIVLSGDAQGPLRLGDGVLVLLPHARHAVRRSPALPGQAHAHLSPLPLSLAIVYYHYSFQRLDV